MIPYQEQIIRFLGERVNTKGYINFQTTFGRGSATKTIKIGYLVMDACTSYNPLLGRASLKKLRAIVSTPHLAMKFLAGRGNIGTIYVDQRAARECYMISLKIV